MTRLVSESFESSDHCRVEPVGFKEGLPYCAKRPPIPTTAGHVKAFAPATAIRYGHGRTTTHGGLRPRRGGYLRARGTFTTTVEISAATGVAGVAGARVQAVAEAGRRGAA